jgi:hypothetical protein
MDERRIRQDCTGIVRVHYFSKRRGTHGKKRSASKRLNGNIWPVAGTVPNGKIHRLSLKINEPVSRVDLKTDVRIVLLKCAKPRHKKLRRERWNRRQVYSFFVGVV